MSGPEDIDQAILDAAAEPQAIAAAGESVTNRSIADLLAAKKALAADAAIEGLADGIFPFARVPVRMPGARGR